MASTKSPTQHDKNWQSYFTSLAPNYARLTSNTTYLVAQKALEIAPPPTSPTALIHDHASGPGTASHALLSHFQTSSNDIPQIIATDYTPAMISAIPAHPKLKAQVADAQNLPFADNHFDYTISNISLQNIQDYNLGLRELYRTSKPGATTVITQWKTFGTGNLLFKALGIFKGAETQMPPMASAELMQKGVIAKLMAEEGWDASKVETHEVVIESDDLEGAEQFMTGPYLPIAAGLGDADKGKWGETVKGVLEEAGTVRCEAFVIVARK